MAESNFQDVVVLSSGTLQVKGQALSIGTDAGAKSVIFANDAGAIYLHGNPTATRSISLPDAAGTVGLITAISAGTTLASNGQIVLSNANGVSFGANGSTITASIAGVGAISAGTTLASSGTVVFSNSNGVTFGVSGNTVTASVNAGAGGGVALAAGTQTATSGTVVLSNSNGVTFGMSGSSRITAIVDVDFAYVMAMVGV